MSEDKDKFNIEKFPTSESAKRMLSFVTTNGWYDKSYVGKWLFQVMGIEIDKYKSYIDDLPNQIFVDSATWGLRYHEQKYSLPIKEMLPYSVRRALIVKHRDESYSITPWLMEQTLKGMFGDGLKISVIDINDPQYTEDMFTDPNTFMVQIEADEGIDLSLVISTIKSIKQSHTVMFTKLVNKFSGAFYMGGAGSTREIIRATCDFRGSVSQDGEMSAGGAGSTREILRATCDFNGSVAKKADVTSAGAGSSRELIRATCDFSETQVVKGDAEAGGISTLKETYTIS